MKNADRHHPLLVVLHWGLAFAIGGMLVYGFLVLGPAPNSNKEKVDLLRPHMALGMGIGALMLIRLLVRMSTRRPTPIASMTLSESRFVAVAHASLYALVFGMVATGFATGLAAGLPEIVFGRSGAPLPDDFDRFAVKMAHTWIAWLLLALTAAHTGAALYRHFARREPILVRMTISARATRRAQTEDGTRES